MKTYEEIKTELIEIADVLKKYPENIQPQVFEILTRHFLGHEKVPANLEQNEMPVKTQRTKKPEEVATSTPSKSVTKSRESISLLKDLDLRPKGHKSFKDFYGEKQPKNFVEFNAIAVYYLEEIIQIKGITANHIYTCYKEANERPPVAFTQSLRDTASRTGYIDTSTSSDIKIPLRGKNFVEHDLPIPKSKSK